MKELITLLLIDKSAVFHWFSKQTLSKIVILLLFAGLFGLVAFIIYFFCTLFFRMLAGYGIFGLLTAQYLLHAAIFVLSSFMIGASIVSIVTFLLTPSLHIQYLKALPVSSWVLVNWFFIRTSFLNIFLLLSLLTPVVIAYTQYFVIQKEVFIISYIFVITLLVLLTNSIGTLLGYSIAFVGKQKIVIWIFLLIAFVILTFSISKILFPRSLLGLYNAQPQSFAAVYRSLPLSQPYIPTYWFHQMLVTPQLSYAVYLILFTGGIVTVVLHIQAQLFNRLYHSTQDYSQSHLVARSSSNYLMKTSEPLIYKDVLSIWRVSSEIGYGFFLFLLGTAFFLLVYQVTKVRATQPEWHMQYSIMAFIWLQFFATSYILRIVFPLMAREGKSAWLLFTLPISKNRIILAKLASGIIISLPYILLSIVLWEFFPFAVEHTHLLRVGSTLSIVTLIVVNVFLGVYMPNFSQGDNPEKVSTSLMGILTLGVSAFCIATYTGLIYSIMTGRLSSVGIVLGLLWTGALVLLTFQIAKKYLQKYSF